MIQNVEKHTFLSYTPASLYQNRIPLTVLELWSPGGGVVTLAAAGNGASGGGV